MADVIVKGPIRVHVGHREITIDATGTVAQQREMPEGRGILKLTKSEGLCLLDALAEVL